MDKIPENIVGAVDALLQPYGVAIRRLLDAANESTEPKEYLSIADIEQRFSISRWTIYRARRAGQLKTLKLSRARGGKVLIALSELRRWLHEHESRNNKCA